jgi:hypothetical protein
MSIQVSYLILVKTIVENNPTAVAQRMTALGKWTATTVTPTEFVTYVGQATTTDTAGLAQTVSTLLDVPIILQNVNGDYLQQVMSEYPTASLKEIVYSFANRHFDANKKNLDPLVLQNYEKNIGTPPQSSQVLPMWAKVVIGILVIVALIGGLRYFFR